MNNDAMYEKACQQAISLAEWAGETYTYTLLIGALFLAIAIIFLVLEDRDNSFCKFVFGCIFLVASVVLILSGVSMWCDHASFTKRRELYIIKQVGYGYRDVYKADESHADRDGG